MKSSHLCCDAHAARNVHTEHHHRVLQVLVVVVAVSRHVDVVGVYSCTLSDNHSVHVVVYCVLASAELTHPHLNNTIEENNVLEVLLYHPVNLWTLW